MNCIWCVAQTFKHSHQPMPASVCLEVTPNSKPYSFTAPKADALLKL